MNVGEIGRAEANRLLEDWAHPLGPCKRPFGQQAYAFDIDGAPVAVAVSASIVSKQITDKEGRVYLRGEVVELARIARHPDHRGILRPMLRLWRDYLAPSWPYRSVAAAISYAMPGTLGDIYRFDGWERIRKCEVSRGGGTWTKNPQVSGIGDGVKTLWLWRYTDA
jgi:hypothetical protein